MVVLTEHKIMLLFYSLWSLLNVAGYWTFRPLPLARRWDNGTDRRESIKAGIGKYKQLPSLHRDLYKSPRERCTIPALITP